MTDYHKIEQTTIDNFDNDIQSILQDCNDDSLTSSQFHFLRGDSDGDRYDERFNNSLSSWFIESENELDNTIESPLINESSDVEIVEETIVDVNETIDDQSKTETTFTNDDKDKTEEKSLTTTIVESKLDEGKNKHLFCCFFFINLINNKKSNSFFFHIQIFSMNMIRILKMKNRMIYSKQRSIRKQQQMILISKIMIQKLSKIFQTTKHYHHHHHRLLNHPKWK